MRVLFFHYGTEDWFGIGYLSSVLKKEGHRTDLLLHPYTDIYVNLPVFSKTRIEKKLLEKAESFKPDLIAFTSTTIAYKYVKKMSAELKKMFDVPQIIGGVHATVLPEHILHTSDIDIVCMGEGEYALLELANRMEQGEDIADIRNLWIKQDGEILKNPLRPLIDDLDALPFPDKDIFRQYGVLTADYNIVASRGCPYRCSYCCNRFYQKLYRNRGRYLRRRSVGNVIEELKTNRRKLGFRSVYFWDDAFVISKKWLEEFSSRYRQEIGLPFHCLSRPEDIDESSAALLQHAGCKHVNMGIESGSESIRRAILDRQMSNEQIIHAARLIKEHGMKLNVFNMFGIPTEGPKEMWETAELNEQISPHGTFAFVFSPFPGTAIADYARRTGMMTDSHVENMKDGILDSILSERGETNLYHPYKDLAITMKTFLPILNQSPSWLRPFLRKMARRKRRKRPGKLMHMLSLLLVDKSRIRYKLAEFWRTLWYYTIRF